MTIAANNSMLWLKWGITVWWWLRGRPVGISQLDTGDNKDEGLD